MVAELARPRRKRLGDTLFSVTWLFFQQFAWSPLITIALTSCFAQPITWRLGVFVVLSLLETAAIHLVIPTFQIELKSPGLEELRQKFPNSFFKQIPLSEYAIFLKTMYPYFASKKESDILPLVHRVANDRVRLLVPAEDTASVLPSTFTTYANIFNAWIVVPASLEQMSGLQHFVLLHEIGHVSMGAVIHLFGVREDLVLLTMSCFFVVIAGISLSPLMMAALSTLFVAAMSLRLRNAVKSRKRRVEAEETTADYFALSRCDPAWFADFPAERLAKALCFDSANSDKSPETTTVREKLMAYDISRLRSGREFYSRDQATPQSFEYVVNLLIFFAIECICGIRMQRFASQAIGHLMIFTVIYLVLGWGLFGLGRASGYLLDLRYGLGEVDQDVMRSVQRGFAIRKTIDSIAARSAKR